MTSRLISLLRMFPRSGPAVGPRPNSWAELALWRRFFQMKEEEEEEITEMILEVVGGENHEKSDGNEDYVSSVEAVEARSTLIREGYRNLVHGSNNEEQNTHIVARNDRSHSRSRSRHRELDDSDFTIPVGEGMYLTRAQ